VSSLGANATTAPGRRIPALAVVLFAVVKIGTVHRGAREKRFDWHQAAWESTEAVGISKVLT
jgi:hypothetical protein